MESPLSFSSARGTIDVETAEVIGARKCPYGVLERVFVGSAFALIIADEHDVGHCLDINVHSFARFVKGHGTLNAFFTSCVSSRCSFTLRE